MKRRSMPAMTTNRMNRPHNSTLRRRVVPRRRSWFARGAIAALVAVICLGTFLIGQRHGSRWFGAWRVQEESARERAHPFLGTVNASGRGGERPLGSVLVLVFPTGNRPQNPLRASDISMSFESAPLTDASRATLREIGADLTHTDAEGKFAVTVQGTGPWTLLVVTNEETEEPPTRSDLAAVGHFVIPAYDLLVGRRYRLIPLSEVPVDRLRIDLPDPGGGQ